MNTLPPLLETYEEARLLLEAKGWGIAKAADHLSELPGMARFHISHNKLSMKTKPGADNAIEPEVAAAVEGMPTWRGHERKTEIVTRGLLALHGDPPSEEVEQLAAELRERLAASEHALKLVEALEEKAGQRLTSLGQKLAEKSASALTPHLVEAIDEKASQRAVRFSQQLAEGLSRASRKQVAISAGSVALVGGLVLLLGAQLLPRRADAAQTGPLVLVLPGAGPNGSTVSFDPRSLSDRPAAWGEKPLDQPIPVKPLPGQQTAPCDTGIGQEEINGNCWFFARNVKPPCGRLFRHEDACYAPVAAEPRKPVP
jgi:hypothetical protein